jgi:hypothetical protein
MIEFKKEELEKLYSKYGSVRRISKKFNIPRSTLFYYFNKYDIDVSKKLKIKKSVLKKLYKELGSVYRIAEKLGEHPSSIYYYIDKYGIDISKNRFPYTKDELIMLHKKYGSITKIAAILSKPYSTVRYWYKQFDMIVNQSSMTIFHELRNTPIEQTQKSVLIGSMLGDGGMWLAPHCKNARLYVCHCEKQLGYLKWVHGLLQPFVRPIVQTEKAGKKMIGNNIVNGSNFYRFYTIAHPDITDIFHRYYSKGLKRVNNTIIDKVDLLAMSIWFGDDGSIQRNKKYEPVSCSIATNSFTYKEHLILVGIVHKFFNGTIRIARQGGYYKGEKRKDYHLEMSGKKHVDDFLNIIKFVLPECIHYKLS